MPQASSLSAVRGALVDLKTGMPTRVWQQNFIIWTKQLANGLDPSGNLISNINPTVRIVGRGGTIGSILQYLDDNGIVLGPGVDFSRAYVNKDTDHITDGTGSPLAGGRTAFSALIAAASGSILGYDGTEWRPVAGPRSFAQAPHAWLDSYSAITGEFTASQPGFTDLSGQLDTAQLPASGLSVTIATAKLTLAGANGSMTFTNGLLTAETQAT